MRSNTTRQDSILEDMKNSMKIDSKRNPSKNDKAFLASKFNIVEESSKGKMAKLKTSEQTNKALEVVRAYEKELKGSKRLRPSKLWLVNYLQSWTDLNGEKEVQDAIDQKLIVPSNPELGKYSPYKENITDDSARHRNI